MKKYFIFFLFLSQSVLIFSQKDAAKSIDRSDLKDFSQVVIEIPADVYVRQSDSFRCRINGANRGLEDVEADVKNGVLSIYRRDKHNWFGSIERIIVIIEAPNFEKFDFSGVGKLIAETKLTGKNLSIEVNGPAHFIADSLDYQHIDVEMNGVGTIEIGGKAVSATMGMNGTGKIDAYDLMTESAQCETSGIGNIYCSVSGDLSAHIMGIGGIRYRGNPKNVRKSVMGIGRVVSRN
jgi:Putative auto-transporter adhesin, head GIN domain